MASVQEIEIKIENLCRTCLSRDHELYSIFDIFVGSTVTLDYIVTSTTGLKISKNDGLPSTICYECKEKAAMAYEFKKKSEEANISLRGLKKEKKESLTSTKDLSQTNTSNVKTEDLSSLSHDNDDYIDSDFNISLGSGPDLHDEAVKIENEGLERKSCYVCKSCLVVFDTHDKLEEHKKICIKVECDETNRTYCPLCGTCYNGAENLTKHMWESHADLMGPKKRGRPKKMLTSTILNKLSENGFCITSMPAKKIECTFCGQHFETKEELGIHAMTHSDTTVLRCLLCKKIYLDRKKFDLHVCIEEKTELKNDSGNSVSNEKKTQNFPSEITLREFLDPNTDMDNINMLIVCNACTCILQSEGDLINHRDAEHPELSHRCNLCTKVFATLRSAARHRSICKQIERKYKCNTCGLKFAYEISLNKHILRYHEGESVSVKFIDPKTKREERQFQCDTCNRCFYKRDLLVKHTKIHMPIENFFQCDVCEKKFHRSDNLRSHKRVHQVPREKTSTNNCLCLYCGRSFSNSSNLIVHMRRHTGEKPYKCDFCGKGFPRSSDLQCHRRSHTGEKPCICRVCGKGFSRSNKLSRHMRVHTGQRPYKCTYCEKAFSQSNDLNLHIRRHTGDRPYICDVCGDRFIQGTALQNHRRAHGHFSAPPPTEATSEVQTLTFTVQSYKP